MNALLAMELEELQPGTEEVQDDAASCENLEEAEHQLKERYRINELSGANWAFRKIRALKQQIEENNALVAEEIMRLEQWLASQNEASENSIKFFEGLIISYFEAKRDKEPKFKLNTPYGKISAVKGKKWAYEEKAAIESLKGAGLPEFIKTEESLRKNDLKDAIKRESFVITDTGRLATADGEVIDGVNITDSETISVKTD